MEKQELIRIIRNARYSLQEYREGTFEKYSSLIFEETQKKEREREDIEREIRELVKESFMLGPSGQVCPKCGGSGRI